jgi:hypothetical protein
MNLPSDLQRLAPFLAVAVLALAGLFVVTRGLGGGNGSAPDANAVMQRALTTSPESGVLNLSTRVSLELATQAGAQAPRSETLTFSGPFVEPKSETDLGQADLTVREVKGGTTTTARALTTGERGFVQVGGSWYELTGAQAKRVFSDEESGDQGPFLKEAGIDVQKWTTNPRTEGSAQVDGVETHRIVGDLDMDALLADLDDQTSASSDSFTRDAAKQGEVELFVGKDDGLLRKVSVRGDLSAQGAGGSARVTIRFDVAIREVNKPQRITAPQNANPPGRIDEVATSRLGPFAEDIRTPRRGEGGGSKAGQRGERSRKAYIDCVSQAQDTAALEKCQRLVP